MMYWIAIHMFVFLPGMEKVPMQILTNVLGEFLTNLLT